MIYTVTQSDIREDNPSVDAIPAFAECTSRELKYVFLAYDYDTPFRNLPFEERKDKAARAAGYHIEKDRDRLDKTGRKVIDGKHDKVNAAIAAFKELRRDIDRETLEAYNTQLEEINKWMTTPKVKEGEWRIVSQLIKNLPSLLEVRKQLIELLELREDFKEKEVKKIEEDEVIAEDSTLTALERRNLKIVGEQ